jgi:hypothetical protein
VNAYPTPTWRDEMGRASGAVEAALARASEHPLSRRKAMLAAVLLDNLCDEAFDLLRAGQPDRDPGAEDVLAFRDRLAAASPPLGLVLDLCAGRQDGPRLEIATVPVPIEDYPRLSVEDFMVSLYNGNSVQRLVIAGGRGGARPALEVFGDALRDLRTMVLGD